MVNKSLSSTNTLDFLYYHFFFKFELNKTNKLNVYLRWIYCSCASYPPTQALNSQESLVRVGGASTFIIIFNYFHVK